MVVLFKLRADGPVDATGPGKHTNEHHGTCEQEKFAHEVLVVLLIGTGVA